MDEKKMIWCTGEGRWIPNLGCIRRQERPKNRCVKTCPHRIKPEKEPEKKDRERRSKPSKFSLLRSAFLENASWKKEDLLIRTGFDEQNLRTAISILKNKNRTKDPLFVDYDRSTKTFVLKQ